MLARLLPCANAAAAPWDAVGWPPHVHLAMFVHRVDGLAPGIYFFARSASAAAGFREATKSRAFAWERPADCPVDLPLYFLQKADCRRAAAQLSLGQAIAGDGAFSLGMIAELEGSLHEYGAWFYRRLFWEAGMIGQVLYLEAEAAAVRRADAMRATGIGAYFDDLVHDVLGLEGHAYQSVYHFTLGGAVDDARLTTRPPYDADVMNRILREM